MDADENQPPSGRLAACIMLILKPLVRAVMARGVSAPGFYQWVKKVYVEVAMEELGANATDSRINVMTGVHRRDVKEFRQTAGSDVDGIDQKVSILATVVGRWMTDPVFLHGADPRVLSRSSSAEVGFDELVQSVSRDIRPRTVLDELLRQQIIAVDGDNVTLISKGLVSSNDIEQKLHFFSHNLADHAAAAVENLMSDTPPHLERAVFYNNLTPHSVTLVEELSREKGLRALEDINAFAAARQRDDLAHPDATERIRFGVFYYQTGKDRPEEGKTDNGD
ncbi:MAG: DUF6502 family protein [Roseobacter sp.]